MNNYSLLRIKIQVKEKMKIFRKKTKKAARKLGGGVQIHAAGCGLFDCGQGDAAEGERRNVDQDEE